MTGMACLLFWSQTVLWDVHRAFGLATKEWDGGWAGLKIVRDCARLFVFLILSALHRAPRG